MRRAYILLLIFLLGFGCIEDRISPSERGEFLLTSESQDLDQDGITDYAAYAFTPLTLQEEGIEVQRHVMVATTTTATYTSVDPNITEIDLLLADESLEEFSNLRFQADSACSKNLGILTVVCSDILSCSRLCSSASGKCKEVAEDYKEVLGGSMISYVQDNNELRSLLLDARRIIVNLGGDATDAERNIFLGKTRDLLAKVSNINANPVYTHANLDLCENSDFGIAYAMEAAKKIGEYETEAESYHYTVLLSMKKLEEKNGGFDVELVGIGLNDRIPKTAVSGVSEITSIQEFVGTDETTDVVVGWEALDPSKKAYMFMYEFSSATPPETLIPSLKTPDITAKMLDLRGLVPTHAVYITLKDTLNNYYVAIGTAFGLTIGALLLLYTVITIGITVLGEKIAGSTFTTGLRKSFGRTDVRWKTDIGVAALFLVGGIYVSTFVAPQPKPIPDMLESTDFLLKSGFGIVGAAAMLIGVVMVYFASENLAKIIMLERIYGMVIRQERDMYIAKAATLKEKAKELEVLIEKLAHEEFDVSKEYDVLSSAKAMDLDKLTAKVTAQSKTIIDERLTSVDSAIAKLTQRKKLADENWPKWKENISRILEEQEEVFSSSLITVPASLRPWVLHRYLKDVGGEGMVLEHNGLKKKRLSADKMVHEMILKGMFSAAIVIRGNSIETADFAEGTGTVTKALALKLRSYMYSLAKKLGQHEPQSFVSIGGKDVLVYMRGRKIESVLIVRKERFNEAIDMWKGKMKMFETGS